MAKLKENELEIEGTVTEGLPDLLFRVQVDVGPEDLMGKEILAKVSGQMRMYRIRVMPGDKVKVVLTQYDRTRGRITYRTK